MPQVLPVVRPCLHAMVGKLRGVGSMRLIVTPFTVRSGTTRLLSNSMIATSSLGSE
ncbi:Uncharacterised protein [Mycobacteroides abscessus subsp. abscessus]|nr:Uncharacterised protein [Mycobacteroides abscessus subsp. abscessus]